MQGLIATQFARHFLTTPGLAVTLMSFRHPEQWEAFCTYADQRRAPAADFTVGGAGFTSFVHDWRTVPPAAWVARLSQQELGVAPTAAAEHQPRVLVLGQQDFAAAVRQGLRDYTRPDRLRTSPLLRCRLVTTRLRGGEGPGEQAEVLKALLKEAAETLSLAPADRRLHRVLVRAYLAPAPTLNALPRSSNSPPARSAACCPPPSAGSSPCSGFASSTPDPTLPLLVEPTL